MTSPLSIPRPVQSKPLLITAGVHVLLVLLLMLWKFNLPAEPLPLPEMGMEVNLGTAADGSGTDQPMDAEDPAAESVAASRNTAQASVAATDMERSEDAEAPDVPRAATSHNQHTTNATTAGKKHAAATDAATVHVAQQQRPRYVYAGSTSKGGNSATADMPGAGEGNTTGDGDRGVPGGTPGAANYTGSPGTGTGGISHSLGGRSIVAFPPKEARFREGGRVIVRVTVDRDGAIVNQQIVSSTNTELSPIALRKLLQVRFNKSETAPAEQFGNITFVFKTRQ